MTTTARPNLATAPADEIRDWVNNAPTQRAATARNAQANAAWTRRYAAGEFDLDMFHAGVGAFTDTAAYRRRWLHNASRNGR